MAVMGEGEDRSDVTMCDIGLLAARLNGVNIPHTTPVAVYNQCPALGV